MPGGATCDGAAGGDTSGPAQMPTVGDGCAYVSDGIAAVLEASARLLSGGVYVGIRSA